jgi:beta-galactosidase
MTEIPLYEMARSWKSLRAVQKPELRRQAALALIEMIERDRNHPSLVVWGLGNGAVTVFPSVKKVYADLYAVAKRFDVRRPAAFAMLNIPFGLTPLLDGSGEVGDAIFLNEYYGWYYGQAKDVGVLLDQFHQRWPGKAVVVSETGAGAVAGPPAGGKYPVWLWYRRDYSEAAQAGLYRKQLPILRARPWVAGVCAWVLADFPDDKRAAAPVADMNLKGLLTRDRKPKLAFGALARLYAEIERGENK